MRKYRVIGLSVLLLALVFGVITCQMFEEKSNLTSPAVTPQVGAVGNFYGARGVSSTDFGVYVPEDGTGEFVLNLPKAGNYWIGYATAAGDFAVIVNTTASALVYVGLTHGDVVGQIWGGRIPESVKLPNATFLNLLLPEHDAQAKIANPVTLLVHTQVLPVSITDIGSCNGEQNCVLTEMLNWVVHTPSYTWPNGGQQGSVADLIEQTQGVATDSEATAWLLDMAAQRGYPLAFLLQEASKAMKGNPRLNGSIFDMCPCTSNSCNTGQFYNEKTGACENNATTLTGQETHPTTCQSSGASCSGSNKCCDGLTCTNGVCAAASSCKTSGTTCSGSTDTSCCANLSCQPFSVSYTCQSI